MLIASQLVPFYILMYFLFESIMSFSLYCWLHSDVSLSDCLPPSSSLSLHRVLASAINEKLWITVDIFISVFCVGKQNFPPEREDPFLQSKHPMTSVKLRKSNPSKFL